ncbi:tetratricopeptide repeat-containing sensor histidine kinase [uncultured Dokdonia sp.]|uniref:tetratricopeptide repeat-containing sensor histidine kinase n=1 Tax=uncultured Dokdonia sp. TaxID=575653 RepID=UPI00260BC2BF|nr:tetratricopeptide repeat-containing sensor histidine kinase [uncultured Dokdonia sp.]
MLLCVCVIFSCENGMSSMDKRSVELIKIDYFLNEAADKNQEKIRRYYALDSASFYVNSLKVSRYDTFKRYYLHAIAKEYSDLKIRDSIFSINHKTLKLSAKTNDSIGLAKSNYNLGLYHLRGDKLDSAYSYLYTSEELYDNLNKIKEAGKSALVMAITQKNKKDYVGSEASSVKAIRLFEKVDDQEQSIASAYNNLGLVSRLLGKYDEAIDYYITAQDYRKKLDDNKILLAGSLNNIGITYKDKGEYNKAIDYYKQGLGYDSLPIRSPRTYARLLDNLAYASYKSGRGEVFPDLFLKALSIRDSINDRLGYVTSNKHIAEVYAEKGDSVTALTYAKAAYNKAKEITYNDGILESLELLMVLESPQKGISYGQEYISLNSKLYYQEKIFQDQSARIRFETDQLEVAKNKATETSRRLIIIFSISVIAFLIGYILLQRRNNRKELEYQEGQQKANEEIFNLMLAQQGKLEEGKHLAKQRISEELHDGILSRLFGLRLSLDSLNNKHGKDVEVLRSSYIDQLKDLGQEIRKISHDLNNETFTQDTLYPDVLKKLLKDQFEAQKVTYDFLYDHTINWDLITNSKKVHIYRIIQECLMNINKHANAKHITVTFKSQDDTVQLTIEDDGIGMDTTKAKSGIGMKNIKSRVAQIAGSYKIISKMNLGTQIQISFN